MFEVLGWSPLHHRVPDGAGGLRPGQRGPCCPHQLPCNHLVPLGDYPGAGAQLRGLGGGGLHQGVGLQQAAAPGHRHQGLRAHGEPARVVGH